MHIKSVFFGDSVALSEINALIIPTGANLVLDPFVSSTLKAYDTTQKCKLHCCPLQRELQRLSEQEHNANLILKASDILHYNAFI